jgi:ribonuclease HI
MEVYDAEIMGAVEGLKAALAAPCAAFSTGIVILLDNLAAVSLLTDGRPAPHRGELTDTFKQLSLQWSMMQGPLPRTPVRVRWVPGHSGITGNEEADMLAKKGAVLDGSHIPSSPSFL